MPQSSRPKIADAACNFCHMRRAAAEGGMRNAVALQVNSSTPCMLPGGCCTCVCRCVHIRALCLVLQCCVHSRRNTTRRAHLRLQAPAGRAAGWPRNCGSGPLQSSPSPISAPTHQAPSVAPVMCAAPFRAWQPRPRPKRAGGGRTQGLAH